MNNLLTQQLKDYGYKKLDLESLVKCLPKDIWVTVTEKNLRREKAHFVFTRKNDEWILSISVINRETKEVYVIHSIRKTEMIEAVGYMIIFLEQRKMMS